MAVAGPHGLRLVATPRPPLEVELGPGSVVVLVGSDPAHSLEPALDRLDRLDRLGRLDRVDRVDPLHLALRLGRVLPDVTGDAAPSVLARRRSPASRSCAPTP